MTYIFSIIILLGVLIFFHELGHFIVARIFGVGVEKFSLGFGPRLVGKKVGITDYRISAVPLGGYVKMVGEEPDADIDPDQLHLSFTHKPVLQRLLIVAAGPVFNVLLAVVILFIVLLHSGAYFMEPVVGDVQAGSPAETAGLRPGDRILAINGTAVESWEQMSLMIGGSEGSQIDLTIAREGEPLSIPLAPRLQSDQNLFGEDTQRYMIGIISSRQVSAKKLSFGQSVVMSVQKTYQIAELTFVSVVKMVQGKLSVKTLGGPIMIAQLAGEQAKEGLIEFLSLMAVISVNLAILNILPIPVLDGGHILFFTIELIIRRPVSIRVREVAQQAGLFVLLMLMILVFYNDISRFFTAQ
jgi:regulator of sigma E protease